MISLDFSILRTLRLKRGVSAEDVAQATGLTRATVLKVEGGKGNPTMSTIEALAKFFNLTTSELVKMSESSSCETCISKEVTRGPVKGRQVSFRDLEIFYFNANATLEINSDPKFHEHTREVFYIIRGRVLITVGDKDYEMKSGDAIRFKALQEHKLLALEDSEIIMVHHNID